MSQILMVLLTAAIFGLFALSFLVGYLQVARERRLWQEVARIAGVRHCGDLPDGSYEHGHWVAHVGKLEFHLVYRAMDFDEQERYYCLFDSTHMPARFTMAGGKISPTWGQELAETEKRLFEA